ncbi:hypothetical protein KM043_010663 [Ampulex compressa]|nr:hypothetical protein KM043_010663 [Ampulex compressa]
MSFSFDASKAQTNATSAGDAASTAALPNFSFEATGAGDAGKPLTTGFPLMSSPAQNKPLFGSTLGSTPVQTSGFNFAATASTNVATTSAALGTSGTPSQTTGLTFSSATTPSTGISFGTPSSLPSTGFPAPASVGNATGFTLGGTTAATTAPGTGLSFGTPKLATGTGFSLGGGETGTPAASTGLTFGTPNVQTSGTGFSVGSTPAATTAPATTTTGTGFNLGSTVASTTTTVSPAFSLGSLAPTSTTTGFGFGSSTTTAATTGFSLSKTASTAALLSLTTPSTQVSLGTTTTVSSATTTGQSAAINFFQLEESINKWTLELEEQEKVFVNQATQVNAWDKLLITNGEKIVTLNQEVERVKIEQQQLEHELDYVVGQQKELQDCLVPLEKELASLSVSDPEREYTYRLAENLDTQLKQMSEDLKEIIEHLNEANRTQDSSDPIVQIGKILNAHMNSLQWLDQQTALLSQKIQQIEQMHQNFRQENERNFSLAYN